MNNRSKSQISGVSTSIRVFEILDLIANGDPHTGLSLSEISKGLNSSKSTIHRHLQTLERLSILEREKEDNYRLGWKILSLAGKYLDNLSLPILAEPFIRELTENTGESAAIAVPAGNEVIYVSKVATPRSIMQSVIIGDRLPMCSTALGKSMLAFFPERKLNEIITLGLPERTPNTITDPEILKAQLDQIRLQGFAVNDMEYEEGVRAVGAPIFNYTQLVIGSISLAGPANRIPLEIIKTIGSKVKDTALAISRRMGYPR